MNFLEILWGLGSKEEITSAQVETKKSLQSALEDSFSSLENLDIHDTIRDMRALADIEQQQIQLNDITYQMKTYLQEKLMLVYAYFVGIGNQEAIDAFRKTFGFDASSTKITKSVYDIYTSLQQIEDLGSMQEQQYDDMKKMIEKDVITQQDALQKKIDIQLSEYNKALQHYEQEASNFSGLPTPEQYEQDLIKSLKSSNGDMDIGEQYLAEQTKDRIIAYRNLWEPKKQKLDKLRNELLQGWKRIEKIKFTEQEARAKELIQDLQVSNKDVHTSLSNEDYVTVIDELEQWAQDIVLLRQELKLNTCLDVDLGSPEETGKSSWKYVLETYKMHANFLAEKQHLTLGSGVEYVSDLTPYLAEELKKISQQDLRILSTLTANLTNHYHFDAGYPHPEQVAIVLLIQKYKNVLERIHMLNKYVPVKRQKLQHIKDFLDSNSDIASPLQKFNLLHSADTILQLADRKTIVVKGGAMYEMQGEMPQGDLDATDLYQRYIDISLIPIDPDHQLYQDRRNPDSELVRQINDQRYTDKLIIDKEYNIVWQDRLYLYNMHTHEIQGTNSPPKGRVVSEILLSDTSNRYLNFSGEDVFEQSFSIIHEFNGSLAKVKNEGRYYINKDGTNILGREFNQIGEFSDGRVAVKEAGDYRRFFVDQYGKNCFDEESKFHQVVDLKFSEGFAVVTNGDKWYFINHQGENIFKDSLDVEQQFDYAYPFSEGLAVVQSGERRHVINKQGKNAFGKTFFDIGFDKKFIEGKLEVKLKKKSNYSYIDKEGRITAIE